MRNEIVVAIKQGVHPKIFKRSERWLDQAVRAAGQNGLARAIPVNEPFGPEDARYFKAIVASEYPLIDQATGILIIDVRISGHFYPLYHNGLDPALTLVSLSEDNAMVVVEQRIPRPLDYVKSALFTKASEVVFYTYKSDGALGAGISAAITGNCAYPTTDIAAQKFAVSLNGGTLKKADLAEVVLECLPTTPRLGLALLPPEGEELGPGKVVWVWNKAGQVGIEIKETAFPLLTLNTPELRQAAQNLVDPLLDGKTAPATINLAVVIGSDDPCRYYSKEVVVDYRLQWQGGFGLAEKTILEFSGCCSEEQRLSVELPAKITVTQASLETLEDFNGQAVAAPLPLLGKAEGEALATSGVRFGETAAGQRLIVTPDAYLAGCAIALASLAPKAILHAELRKDDQQGPDGVCLWKARRDLPATGWQGWIEMLFDEPIPFESGVGSWLMLRIEKGSAVWLTTAGDEPVRLFQPTKAGSYSSLSCLSGMKALVIPIFSPSQLVSNDCPLSLTINRAANPVPPVANNQGRWRRDLTPLLTQEFIAAGKPLELVFISARKGRVIVYPLTLECTV